MGLLDRAKEALSHAAEKIKDPAKNVVESNWPAGEAPGDLDNGSQAVADPELDLDPVQGTDPDLNAPADEQYDED